MKDKIFVDTNIWVYLYSDSPKSNTAKQVIETFFDNIIISTQVLTELYNVLVKKNIKTPEEAIQIITEISNSFSICTVSLQMVLKALKISKDLKFSVYDSLIISAAEKNDCKYLCTEDMQNNQVIHAKMKIINPFAENSILLP